MACGSKFKFGENDILGKNYYTVSLKGPHYGRTPLTLIHSGPSLNMDANPGVSS